MASRIHKTKLDVSVALFDEFYLQNLQHLKTGTLKLVQENWKNVK